jgi:hypothetical protein
MDRSKTTRRLIGTIDGYNFNPEELRLLEIHPRNFVEYILWLEAVKDWKRRFRTIASISESIKKYKTWMADSCDLSERALTIDIMPMINDSFVDFRFVDGCLEVGCTEKRYNVLFNVFDGRKHPQTPHEEKMQMLYVTDIAESIRLIRK